MNKELIGFLDYFQENKQPDKEDRLEFSDFLEEHYPFLTEEIATLRNLKFDVVIFVEDNDIKVIPGRKESWRFYSYDVWFDEYDGPTVNNVFETGTVIEVIAIPAIHNEGTEFEFVSYSVPDSQFIEETGTGTEVDDGSSCEDIIYMTDEDGIPCGEWRKED